MDTHQIHAAAGAAGIAPEAFDHVAAKVRAHFADGTPPKPADLAAFLTALPVWEKLGMDKATFDGMPMTWRLAQGWAHQAPTVSRRPETRVLTAEELSSLKGLAWAEYLTRGRAMQQTPLGSGPDET
jgi:hypothetical protein